MTTIISFCDCSYSNSSFYIQTTLLWINVMWWSNMDELLLLSRQLDLMFSAKNHASSLLGDHRLPWTQELLGILLFAERVLSAGHLLNNLFWLPMCSLKERTFQYKKGTLEERVGRLVVLITPRSPASVRVWWLKFVADSELKFDLQLNFRFTCSRQCATKIGIDNFTFLEAS